MFATSASGFSRPLEQLQDAPSAGGKAWTLGRMLRLGLPVPPGFALTAAAYQTFLDENRLGQPLAEIIARHEGATLEAARNAAAEVQAMFQAARLPGVLRQAVHAGRQALDAGQPLVVRSSAVGEDSEQHSFAGQLDSFLNITSNEELEAAVLRCWASCWSVRSLHYQRAHRIPVGRMGVVIQEQIDAQAAGVLFTRSPDPSIGKNEMVAEYCLGLGEALVSGQINPGRLTISRSEARATFLARPDPPDAAVSGAEPIQPHHVQTLHRIGLLLEREFHGPQDIEWTIDQSGRVWIVQSRPITGGAAVGTLASGRHAAPGVRVMMWSNANINENYPDPVSPLLYSVAADGYYHYFRNLAGALGISPRRIRAMDVPLRNIIGVHGARLYYNLTNIHAVLRMAPCGEQLVEFFNVFVGASERTSPTPGDDSFGGPQRGRWKQLAELVRILLQTSWQFLFLRRRVAQFERTVDEYARSTHPETLPRQSLAELHAALRQFLEIRCHHWVNASLADAASMIGYGLLKRVASRGLAGREEATLHNRLLQGLPDLVSARPVSALWVLSRRIRSDIALRALFESCPAAELARQLPVDDRFAEFRREFGEYLEQWGYRCSGELMLTVRSFQEDPCGALAILQGYVALDGDSPVEALEREARERVAETRRAYGVFRRRKFLGIWPWPHGGTVLALVLKGTQAAIALRERARLKQSLLYSRFRRVLLRFGEELLALGYFSHREDVFFLTHQELDALVLGSAMFPHAVGQLVALRRAEQARLARLRLPESMTLPVGVYRYRSADQGEADPAEGNGQAPLQGTGACGGTVTARAMVLNDATEAGRLNTGDILVTRQTDPGWAPVFFVVRGLVIERGGMLSHGAIIAREYGLPTVVGVRDATRKIRSGQTVQVDGDTGRVHILD